MSGGRPRTIQSILIFQLGWTPRVLARDLMQLWDSSIGTAAPNAVFILGLFLNRRSAVNAGRREYFFSILNINSPIPNRKERK